MSLRTSLKSLYELPPRESVRRIVKKFRGASSSSPSKGQPDPARVAGIMRTLQEKFEALKTPNLKGIDAAEFQQKIESRIGSIDAEAEGFKADELEKQRDLSIKFHWGHDHDFGSFRVTGRTTNRHFLLPAHFCSLFPISLEDFNGKRVMDIGCWTGGTSLVLAQLGARVTALEEVKKYAETAQFLADSFGLGDRMNVEPHSIYRLNSPEWYNRFDIIFFPGVIYHLSDPLIALRILYNACVPGGTILIETEGMPSDGRSLCIFEGTHLHRRGNRDELNRGGWNWFIPSAIALERMIEEAGFDDVQVSPLVGRRLYAYARRLEKNPICRAGLSVPDIP